MRIKLLASILFAAVLGVFALSIQQMLPRSCVALEGPAVTPEPNKVWEQPAGTVRIGLVWALNGPLYKVFLRAEDNVTFRNLGGKMYHFSPQCEKDARRDFDDMVGTTMDPLDEVKLDQLEEGGFVLNAR